jgi:hypothetical protein
MAIHWGLHFWIYLNFREEKTIQGISLPLLWWLPGEGLQAEVE